MISPSEEKVAKAAGFIKEKFNTAYEVGILTGTGLGKALNCMLVDGELPYDLIPGFPVSTAPGHSGRLFSGTMSGKASIALSGRFHLYEGYSAEEVAMPIRVMKALGVKTLFIASAAGGLNTRFFSGDVMAVRDHINLTGFNPLRGPNIEAWGERFPDMNRAYDAGLFSRAMKVADDRSIPLRQGVYAGLLGPSLETRAERRFLQRIGADAVGFSTVMEVIAAVHLGIQVLAFTVITNMALPEETDPMSIEAVIAAADMAAPKVCSLISGVSERLD